AGRGGGSTSDPQSPAHPEERVRLSNRRLEGPNRRLEGPNLRPEGSAPPSPPFPGTARRTTGPAGAACKPSRATPPPTPRPKWHCRCRAAPSRKRPDARSVLLPELCPPVLPGGRDPIEVLLRMGTQIGA